MVGGRRFGNNDKATWRTPCIPMRFPSGDRIGNVYCSLCYELIIIISWSGGVENTAISFWPGGV